MENKKTTEINTKQQLIELIEQIEREDIIEYFYHFIKAKIKAEG